MNNKLLEPPAEELTDTPAPARKVARAALAAPRKSVLIINYDNSIHYEDDQSVLTFMSAFQNIGDEVRIERSRDISNSTLGSYDIVA